MLYIIQGLEAHQEAFSPREDQYLQTFIHTLSMSVGVVP